MWDLPSRSGRFASDDALVHAALAGLTRAPETDGTVEEILFKEGQRRFLEWLYAVGRSIVLASGRPVVVAV